MPKRPAPGIAKQSKKINKEKKEQSLRDQIMKITAKKTAHAAQDFGEIDITPKLGFKKSTQQQIQREKIKSGVGKSKIEAHKNKELFTPQPTMK